MNTHAPHLIPLVGQRDHIRGLPDAPYTLAELGDFECPFCGAAHLAIEEVRQQMGEDLRFVFRHFPLVSLHPRAEIAAEAAEAAGAQGRFWEMHDRLFENQDALDDEDLLAHAAALELDLVRFARELDARVYAPRIQEDVESGISSGVEGTPSFYINGLKYGGRYDVDSLMHALQRARKAA